jgi:hypothetical protein
MGIVIDPSATPPTPPVEATSPDGVLTARRDDAWAGVLLVADYTAASSTTAQVRFVRVGPDGTEQPVRSGDPAWAPGGQAVAYDQEAPLGTPVSWYAYPVGWDGAVGTRSEGVALTIPEPEPLADVWLKSLADPAASLRVVVTDWPALSYDERQQRADVIGRAAPVLTVDAWSTGSGDATILTQTLDERAALLSLLTSRAALLAQTRAVNGRPDQYVVPGKISEALAGASDDPARVWTVTLTGVDRPPTVDTGLRIPGRSYADSAVMWPTYADRTATGQTYGSVTTGG